MIWALISLIEAVIILANRGGFGATSMVLSVVFFPTLALLDSNTPKNNQLIDDLLWLC